MISPTELRRGIPALAELSDATVGRMAAAATERRYAAKRILFRAGERADGLYLLLDGRVRVSRESPSRAQLLHLEEPGGVLGEIPVFGGGPFPGTAIAIERSRCAHLSIASVERLLRDDSEFARFALHRLARRAHSLLRRIDELTTTTISSRLATYLMERASNGGEFTLGMSQEELAEELGTAREVVVRGLASLVAAGAIRRTGRSRFRVERLEVLRALSSGQ